ncbi:GH92 family glycosyl hydrolase [uncultured Algibacter sp.]|uniref:GH92 family glycosyl hydrolase n=1 Tax=uncultured Algibacter sp. TaxID=298659 RepID=UPI00261DA451|nr:GH92 family glycosyl hydrolase [uncultured Algibacter sp.]
MKSFRFLKYVVVTLLCIACHQKEKQLKNRPYVNYVNPLIGTAPSTTISALKHGHGKENNAQVVPYVTVPFGMTNWTPQTKATETKCHAPYYYKDSIISGFRGSHWLSGSCVQDYGSMTIMPISGDLKCLPEKRGSTYSHTSEKATPYEYQVLLNDYNIDVRMTATKRCGLLKFTFNNEGESHIVINPNSDEGQGFVNIDTLRNEITGFNPVHRIYQGWGEEAGFSGYFVARLSKKPNSVGVYQNETIFKGDTEISNLENLGAYASFNCKKGDIIYVSIGTSFTSIAQARKNLEAEVTISHETATNNLKSTWEQLLSKVKVEGKNEDDKVKFYTALYHSFLQPRTFNDADGTYVSFANGKKELNAGNVDYFVDFSMWDTYRASHPLFNLITPKVSADMMHSLFLKAEQGEWLPIFPCWNSYTSAMIGDHVIATVADAYMKDIINIDDKQYAYLLKNAFQTPSDFNDYKDGKGRRALKSYLKYGYIPLEDEVKESFHTNEQVSRTLEYAFDDFTLSQVATKKGDVKSAKTLKRRALNYKNVYSTQDSCVRAKYANGKFIDSLDKFVRQPYITEGTPYQYTWYVPHDVKGLVNLMGGDDGFNANLDNFHEKDQYWHGNEPGHQIPFMYNYSGQPWKTQELVSNIMKTEYSSDVGGLSGNDDAGQMSAWYVFAAMGFYPVAPSVPEYVISGPHFDDITLVLDSGKTLRIRAEGTSEGKKYIQSITFNGEPYHKTYFNHFDLMKGGNIVFTMGNTINTDWGTKANSRPFSMSK